MRTDQLSNMVAQGGIITIGFLDQMRGETVINPFVKPQAFATFGSSAPENKKKLGENISESFDSLLERWDAISNSYEDMDISDARRKWIIPLLRELGFDPAFNHKDVMANGDEHLKFKLSHRGWVSPDAPMIHTVAPKQDLETRPNDGKGSKRSPHDEMQTFLNVSKDHKWGIVTNGISFRILRDFFHTTTKGYVEFDIENIMRERSYSDFRAFYRMAHASRFRGDSDNGDYPLEQFYKESVTAGEKVGSNLRGNVKKAIEVFGNGFLTLTPELTGQMIADEELCKEYYNEILRVIYRILFLLYAEQRAMLPTRNSLYIDEYSITRLRKIAESRKGKDDHCDLWEGLKITFRMLAEGCKPLNVFAYNGSLFDKYEIPTIRKLAIKNHDLLEAIRCLTLFEEDRMLKRINYLDLDAEEIGSIYESLLDYTPRVLPSAMEIDSRTIPANTFFLDPRGSARKTTGSYYTDKRLVDELIKTALKPVAEIKMAESEDKEAAILSLKVCDPACGSGAFLIAATNYLGKELAKVRTGQSEPPDEDIRRARRDVLQRCIYGVDLNPMVVELAKVSLWIDAAVTDKPLNFLNHHIKCGNSLIGATPELIEKGIPDEAFNPVEGDDRKVAKEIKSKNKKEKKQQTLGEFRSEKEPTWTEEYAKLSHAEEDDVDSVKWKQECYRAIVESPKRQHEKLVADTWCAAFFWQLNGDAPPPPTEATLRMIRKDVVDTNLNLSTKSMIRELANEYKFFHWHLEFPDVFEGKGKGFDCVLGNPPWDMIKENSDEFFSFYDLEYRGLNSKQKKERIKQLCLNPEINKKWQEYGKIFSHLIKYYTNSSSYLHKGSGHLNAFKLFLERFHQIIAIGKKMGILVPSGVYTDKGCTELRKLLFDHSKIKSLFCFENGQKIFPIHSGFKFVTLAAEKGGHTETFSSGFMLHDLDILPKLENNGLILPVKLIKKFSPATLSIMEFADQNEINLMEKIYSDIPLLGEKIGGVWNVVFHRELNQTDDHKLLQTTETSLPIFEGKMIHHFYHLYEKARYWLLEKDAVNFYTGRGYQAWKYYRLAYRAVASSTNETTLICTIIPKNTGSIESLRVIELFKLDNTKNQLVDNINSTEQSFLASLMNSFIINYIIRRKVSTNLSAFYMYQLPIPRLTSGNWYFDQIVPRAARLICTTEAFADFWSDVYRSEWNNLSVNDGGTSLLEDWNKLTPTWMEEYGAHGWDGTKHDIESRVQLRCEIDALVAHLYSLNKEELEHILSTFPIVKEKSPWLIDGTVREFERLETCMTNENKITSNEFYGLDI